MPTTSTQPTAQDTLFRPPRAEGPAWRWSTADLQAALTAISHARAALVARMESLDVEHRQHVEVEFFVHESVASSAIDGVVIDAVVARSAMQEHLSAAADPARASAKPMQGLVDILVEVSRNTGPLSEARLRSWHAALVAPARTEAATGTFRAALEPDRIAVFLHWFNEDSLAPEAGLDPCLRACIAQLWFEVLRPFDEGNGRLGRAVRDLAITQHNAVAGVVAARICAQSPILQRRRKDYLRELEAVQRGAHDITGWLKFAADCVAQACAEAATAVDRVMQITWFWVRHRGVVLNERQRRALECVLSSTDADDPWLTNRRYVELTGCGSPVTASRDLTQLEQRGLIRRDPEAGGRSTRYEVVLR